MISIPAAAVVIPRDKFWELMSMVRFILAKDYEEERLELLVANIYRKGQEEGHCCVLLPLLRYRDGSRGVDIPDYIAATMPCR